MLKENDQKNITINNNNNIIIIRQLAAKPA
jgi:hypothetical protein